MLAALINRMHVPTGGWKVTNDFYSHRRKQVVTIEKKMPIEIEQEQEKDNLEMVALLEQMKAAAAEQDRTKTQEELAQLEADIERLRVGIQREYLDRLERYLAYRAAEEQELINVLLIIAMEV